MAVDCVMLLTRRVALALLAVSLVACYRNTGAEGSAEKTFLRVENQAFLDMNIYVVHRGQRTRVGTVGGGRTQTFELRVRLSSVEPLQFIADPIGGDRLPVSDEILVTPGDTVTLTIPPR